MASEIFIDTGRLAELADEALQSYSQTPALLYSLNVSLIASMRWRGDYGVAGSIGQFRQGPFHSRRRPRRARAAWG